VEEEDGFVELPGVLLQNNYAVNDDLTFFFFRSGSVWVGAMVARKDNFSGSWLARLMKSRGGSGQMPTTCESQARIRLGAE
jgi:hypothetical protein